MIRVFIVRLQRDPIIFLGLITSRASIICLEKSSHSTVGHRANSTIFPMRREWSRQSSVAMTQLAEAQVMVMVMIPHLGSATLSASPAEISCTRVVTVEEADLHQEHQEEREMMRDDPI